VSGVGKENLAALKWGIPLDKWWAMPKTLRVAHIAAIEAEGIIQGVQMGDSDGSR